MLQAGQYRPQDSARASALYARSCQGGQWIACVNLGSMYASADGVPRDEAKAVAKDEASAQALYRRACLDGVRRDCDTDGGVPGG